VLCAGPATDVAICAHVRVRDRPRRPPSTPVKWPRPSRSALARRPTRTVARMTEHCTRRVWEYRAVMAQRLQELPPQGTMALAGRCDANGCAMVLETGGLFRRGVHGHGQGLERTARRRPR